MAKFFFLIGCLILAFNAAGAEGPRAFFGFVTHYETSASGQGAVLVRSVVPSGPAERAGLRAGDRIVAFNGVTFTFADEYQYMRSLEVFESGRKLTLTVDRGGQKMLAELTPEPLAPQQVVALAEFMEKLGSCMATGKDCPCSVDHGVHPEEEDFRTPYRRFTDAIPSRGGRTVLTIAKDSAGQLHFSSDPVDLPSEFEITPEEDGMLWQRIQALPKGQSLQIEITSPSTESRQVRILSP